MAIDRQPETQLKNQQQGLQAQKTALTSIQTALQTLALNASALDDPGLWSNSQTVTSSDATRVSATMGPSGGAGVGGYQVSVSQLANSSQRTFTYASPAAAETITIDGHQTAIAANASIDDFVSAVNSDSNATVYAAKTDTGTVVLSSRTSGAPAGAYIQVSRRHPERADGAGEPCAGRTGRQVQP